MDLSSGDSVRQDSAVRRIVSRIGGQNVSLLIALGALVLLFGGLQPEIFFSPRNISAILNAVVILGIVAMAQTVVIISGGIDISVGSTVGMCSVFAALILANIDSTTLGILGAITLGACAGVVNGLIITYGKVNPIITTLGTMSIFQGAAFIVSNGRAVGVIDGDFNWIGSGRIYSVPFAVILLIAIAALMIFFMRATDIGRNIYAIGGSENAARLAGIRITRYRIAVYSLAGALAGVAAILLTARANSGQPSSGSQGLELESITAAFLGGCIMAGGKGTIVGTLIGVLIIGVLSNGMLLMQVPNFYQNVAKGMLLIGAVMLMEYRVRRSDRRAT